MVFAVLTLLLVLPTRADATVADRDECSTSSNVHYSTLTFQEGEHAMRVLSFATFEAAAESNDIFATKINSEVVNKLTGALAAVDAAQHQTPTWFLKAEKYTMSGVDTVIDSGHWQPFKTDDGDASRFSICVTDSTTNVLRNYTGCRDGTTAQSRLVVAHSEYEGIQLVIINEGDSAVTGLRWSTGTADGGAAQLPLNITVSPLGYVHAGLSVGCP